MPSWLTHPLVSGLMVFERASLETAARESIRSFTSQDWPYKELVIFNSTLIRLEPVFSLRQTPIREIKLKSTSASRMMRTCFENASGEWCLNWQPDCVYAPSYIAEHMACRDKQRLVLLGRMQVYDLKASQMSAINGGAGTLFWSFYRHLRVDFGAAFEPQFSAVHVLDNQAQLATKFVREIN